MTDLTKYWSWKQDELSDEGRTDILFQDHFLSVLDNRHDILDAGCGVGHLVRKLQAQGKNAVGLTYNPDEVTYAKEKFGTDLTLGDLHDPPFPDQSFDAVVCWDALEHCIAPYHVLNEFKRVLRPNGVLLLFMPGQNWLHCKYHILCLTIQQMLHLFDLAGYRQVAVTDFSSFGERVNEGQTQEMAVYVAVV